jgi:hypothetical protein
MRRTSIWFTTEQLNRLAQSAKRDGLKSAHLVRLFVNQGLARHAGRRKAA